METNRSHGILTDVLRVRTVVADSLGLPVDEVLPTSRFAELQASSLDMAQLILDLEDEFHIEIPQDDWGKILQVEDIVKFL